MSQQVNLYQPIFRKQKIIFSARTVLILSAGFAALLILWSVLIGQRVSSLEAELERQRASEQRALAQITQMRQSLPETEPVEIMEQRIEALRTQRSQLRASLTALDQTQPAASARLPERLAAISRQQPSGVWLTELVLDDTRGDLVMRGRALGGQLIPLYLRALGSEPLISGTAFRQVRLEAADDDIPGIHFFISTRPEETSR